MQDIRLRVLPTASRAAVNQHDYYLEEAGSSAALRWQIAVDEAITSLLLSPERGSLCKFNQTVLQDLRRVAIPGFPKHLIIYRYLKQQNVVVITHVVHGARDLERLLTLIDPDLSL